MKKNATGTTAPETGEKAAPRIATRRVNVLMFGLIPALAVGFFVLAIGLISRPPAYVARASFAVDWNEMAAVFGDENAEKVREVVRKGIIAETTALPQSGELSDILDPDGTLSNSQRAALTAKVRESLRITLASQTDEKDCFAVQFRTDDAAQAETVVRRVLRCQLSDLNDQAFVLSLAGAARAKSDLDDIKEQQANDRESGDGDSSASEWKQLQAGLSLVKNAVGMFLTPAKVVEEVHVENTVGNHVARVFFAAFLFGGAAGIAGLGLGKVRISAKTFRSPELAIASVLPPKLPSTSVPPVIAQLEIAKPPILPPPILNR